MDHVGPEAAGLANALHSVVTGRGQMAGIKNPALFLQLSQSDTLPHSQWMRVGQRHNKPVLADRLEGETLRFRDGRM